MEQLIKFKLPEYIGLFDNIEYLVNKPICICYQYNINKDNYGPYGFNTPLAEKLLNFLFENVKFWNQQTLEQIDSIFKTSNGIYFYDGFMKLKQLFLEVNKYKIILKKNTYYLKKGGNILDLPKKPILLEIFDDDGFYKSSTLNKLLDLGISFYIRQHYSPQAGDSFIIFDKNRLANKMTIFNECNEMNFREVNSIDELKSW